VLKRAAGDHARWLEKRLPAPRIAVNVSALQLRQRNFVATVAEALGARENGGGIDLEITESAVMHDVQATTEKLKSARALGVEVAIDDFGTGYSSLAYLAKLPVQILKVDRSFIQSMLPVRDVGILVETIIGLAHSLRLKVVAEGVETEEQAQRLRGLGCDQMQGYLVSRPVPCEQLERLITGPAATRS
jgi:EAL domain-containing protein (putative c-di-GMP-specific phosphodiesterase class I)